MLQVNDIIKNFGGLRALDRVSFKINEGEVVGVIGPNGSGRSTAFNVSTGFLPASGGGGTSGSLAELSILRGTSAGKRASFSFAVSFNTGDPVPTGNLTFIDHDLKKKVEAPAIDTFSATATVATFTGRANVNGVPGVKFTVVVEDQGASGDGTDSVRITLADGYSAGGELLNGNITVESALLSNQ